MLVFAPSQFLLRRSKFSQFFKKEVIIMFTIKNAIKNIYRYRNKYILFGILYFVTICAAVVSFNIYTGIDKIADDTLKDYGAFYFRLMGESNRFLKDEYLKYKNVEHVDDLKFYKYNFITNDLKEHIPELNVQLNLSDETKLLKDIYPPVFILGYNTSLLHLAADEFNIEYGRMFENNNECVISINSKSSADSDTWSKLDLGNKIIIENTNGIYKEFVVVGIQRQDTRDDEHTNRRVIYTTLESAEYFEIIASDKKRSYFLGNDEDLKNPDFISAITDKAMGYESLIYLDSHENYQDFYLKLIHENLQFGLQPLYQDFHVIKNFVFNIKDINSRFAIIITFIIMVVTIISTIVLLNSRKYEIAILRSAGMKKRRLILNYLLENIFFVWGITIISFIVSAFISNIFINDILSDSPLSANNINVNFLL